MSIKIPKLIFEEIDEEKFLKLAQEHYSEKEPKYKFKQIVSTPIQLYAKNRLPAVIIGIDARSRHEGIKSTKSWYYSVVRPNLSRAELDIAHFWEHELEEYKKEK